MAIPGVVSPSSGKTLFDLSVAYQQVHGQASIEYDDAVVVDGLV